MSKLSEMIKELMDERGFSVSQMAEQLQIKDTHFYKYLNGERTPAFPYFVKLLEIFDCSADYLLGLKEFPPRESLHPVPPFHERLRFILTQRGISQEKLKRELPASSSAIYKWLKGISQPYCETLIRLANYFECSVDYLIGRVR